LKERGCLRVLFRNAGGARIWLCCLLACLVMIGLPIHSDSRAEQSGEPFHQRGRHQEGTFPLGHTGAEGAASEGSYWDRWERVGKRPLGSETSSISLPVLWGIKIFRKYISRVDGPSCTFSPTCSSYGQQAIRKHGLLMGLPMTAERVIRSHNPSNPDRYPLLESEGRLFYGDSVESNDFWWKHLD